MDSHDFTLWLRGFAAGNTSALTKEQWSIVVDKLNSVVDAVNPHILLDSNKNTSPNPYKPSWTPPTMEKEGTATIRSKYERW